MTPLMLLLAALTAEPYRQTLISVSQNINPESLEVTSDKVTPDSPHKWSVQKRRLHGGKQEGVDIITIDNGKLQIVVVPSRGMGIWEVKTENVRLGWDSPVKEIVHPSQVNLTARGGLGWLDGFGEFLCRCGLENNGHPGRDTIVDNTGKETTVDLTLHGKQAYLPAQEVELIVQREPPYQIRLVSRIDERMMHGPKLVLHNRISTSPGNNSFFVTDDVENASAAPAEFQLLYHCNFGPPILADGTRLLAPIKRVVPFNERAAEGNIRDFATYGPPTPGYVEQVYCVWPYEDVNGDTTLLLKTEDGKRAVQMTYSAKALPYLTVWKNTAAEQDGYVTGIEPGTNFPYNRFLERKAGRVPTLKPGEKRRFRVAFSILEEQYQIASAENAIKQIQRDRPTEFVNKPQPPTPDPE